MTALLSALVAWVGLAGFTFAFKRAVERGSWVAAAVSAPFAIAFVRCAANGIPIVWPILSGWGWLLLASIVGLVVQAVASTANVQLRRTLFGLVSVFAAVPAWLTRSEDHLLLGTVPTGLAGPVTLLLFVIVAVAVSRRLDSSAILVRRVKRVGIYSFLLGGSLIFSLPFFWLLLTSFKEERDMSNANGLIWVPRVTETERAFDPLSPLYQIRYNNQTVQVEKLGREKSGVRVTVVRPGSLAGTAVVVPEAELVEVPREIKVVEANLAGGKVRALLLNEDSEGAHLRLMDPSSRTGDIITVGTDRVEPIRKPGLLWKNYPDALDALPAEAEYGLAYLRNTLYLCLMSVLGTLVSCTLVAYGFARLRFPGRNIFFGVLLATMMMPGAVTMLPSFLIFRQLGWIDSLKPMWVPTFLGSAFNIFLLRQFFLTLPVELEEAAKIDGCGHLRTLGSIMVPQIKPALVVVGIWTFIGAWNNFMGPLIYVSSPEKMTIAYAMQLFAGDKSTQPGLLMAFATMALAPVVLLFFLAQRTFVEGISLTGKTG